MVLRKAETIVANFMFFVFNSLSFCLILIQNYGKFMAVLVYMVSTNYLSTKTIILLRVLLLFGVILFVLDRDPGKHGLPNIIGGETPRFNNIMI